MIDRYYKIVVAAVFLFVVNNLFSQISSSNFYEKADNFFKVNVKNGLVNYKSIAKNKTDLNGLITEIGKYTPSDEIDKKAFLINAYNIFVIKLLSDQYPTKSPLDTKGFYKDFTLSVLGKKLSLDDLETNELRKIYKDARLHFVLVCGAIGCPPIQNYAFTPSKLNEQMDQCVTSAVNKDLFVKFNVVKNEIVVSEIFKWYEDDFKSSGGVIKFINKFRTNKVTGDAKISYSTYNWTINEILGDLSIPEQSKETLTIDQAENVLLPPNGEKTESVIENEKKKDIPIEEQRFVPAENGPSSKSTQDYTPSVLYTKGEWEYKFFNNLYTQTKGFDKEGNKVKYNTRGSYFSSINQVLFGVNSIFNIGLDFWIKSVRKDDTSSSPLNLFTFENSLNGRTALTNIGPKIKFQPFKKLSHLSVQSTFLFPIAKNQEGVQNEKPYLSEQSYIWITQIFYDYSINKKFQLFFQVAPWLYIKQKSKEGVARTSLSSPVAVFLSYFPTDRLTFYIQQEFWPNFGDKGINSWFRQEGIGAKFQILKGKLETEASITKFSQGKSAGAGSTYNFGLRYIH